MLGDIDAASVGNTLLHEHVLFDIVPPHIKGDRTASISLTDRWQINYRSNENPANACQTDTGVATRELHALAQEGGSLIVDQSVGGLARNPLGLQQASRDAGVHIVACAGLYTADYLDDKTRSLDTEQLTERFVAEVNTGLDGTNVRAGLIGEIGCSWPLEAIEHRAVVAAARASSATGAAVSIHPGRHPEAPAEIIDLLLAEGVTPGRIVICHMDRTYPDGVGIELLLKRGVNVEWDFFGIEQSHYWMGNVELPTDRQRLALIRQFANSGYAGQLCVSQDICTKTRLLEWGGHGYAHLLLNVMPLMSQLGFSDALVKTLLIDNPRRILTIEDTST